MFKKMTNYLFVALFAFAISANGEQMNRTPVDQDSVVSGAVSELQVSAIEENGKMESFMEDSTSSTNENCNACPVKDMEAGENACPVKDMETGENACPVKDMETGENACPVKDMEAGENACPVKDMETGKNNNYSKYQGFYYTLGAKASQDQKFDMPTEVGEVELKSKSLNLTLGKRFSVEGVDFGVGVFGSWTALEMLYGDSLGKLELKAALSYGVNLDVSIWKDDSQKVLALACFEKGSFEGDEFHDAFNARYGVPFLAKIDFEQYKVGLAYEKSIDSYSRTFLVGASLYYTDTDLDMSTGWFLNAPAKMEAKNHVGGTLFISPKLSSPYMPKLEITLGEQLGASLSIGRNY